MGLIAFASGACGRSNRDVALERAPTITRRTTSTTSSTSTTATTSTTTTTTKPPPATEPPPVSETTPEPPPEPPSSETQRPEAQPPGPAGLVCRAAWGAQSPRSGGRAHTISRLTVHHSAGTLADGDDPTRHLRSYQSTHMGSKGWVDIAYHVAVDRAGTAYELRSTAIAGDTATNYDPAGHFLVLAIGNFEEQDPTEAQLDGVARLLRWGADNFGAPLSSVTGHRDHASTACPGRGLYTQLAEVRRRAEAIPAGSSGVSSC